jgi:hypothetical protein
MSFIALPFSDKRHGSAGGRQPGPSGASYRLREGA